MNNELMTTITSDDYIEPTEEITEEVEAPIEEEAPALEPEQAQEDLSDKEINFKRLRQEREADKRLIEELLQRQRAADERERRRILEQEREQLEFEEYSLRMKAEELKKNDGDLLEYKDYRKHQEISTQQQDLQRRRESFERQQEQERIENVRRAMMEHDANFYNVVNEENINKLSQLRPALFKSLVDNPDVITKGLGLHRAIKEYVAQDRETDEDMLLRRNSAKPKTLSGMKTKPQSPLSTANKAMTWAEKKRQRQEEMAAMEADIAKRY